MRIASQQQLLAHVIHCIAAASMFASKRVQKNVRVMVGVAARCRARRDDKREAHPGVWCGRGGVQRDLSCAGHRGRRVGQCRLNGRHRVPQRVFDCWTMYKPDLRAGSIVAVKCVKSMFS